QNRLYTMAVDSGASAEGVSKNLVGSYSRAWHGFPLRIDGAPSGGGGLLGELHSTATTNTRCQIRFTSAGAVVGSIIGGTTTGAVTISFGSFHWIEMIADFSSTSCVLYWRIDGSDQTTATKTIASADTGLKTTLESEAGDGTMTWYAGGYYAFGGAS